MKHLILLLCVLALAGFGGYTLIYDLRADGALGGLNATVGASALLLAVALALPARVKRAIAAVQPVIDAVRGKSA